MERAREARVHLRRSSAVSAFVKSGGAAKAVVRRECTSTVTITITVLLLVLYPSYYYHCQYLLVLYRSLLVLYRSLLVLYRSLLVLCRSLLLLLVLYSSYYYHCQQRYHYSTSIGTVP